MNFLEKKLKVENDVNDYLDEKLADIARFFESDRNSLGEEISDDISKILKELQIPYKYIINTFIMQKGASGFVMSARFVWNPKNDYNLTIEKSSGQNVCLINIWALSLNAIDSS